MGTKNLEALMRGANNGAAAKKPMADIRGLALSLLGITIAAVERGYSLDELAAIAIEDAKSTF